MRHEGAVLFAFALSVMAAPCLAQSDQAAQRATAPNDANVYFIEPRNGQTVGPHVHLVFGTRNFGGGSGRRRLS